MKVHVTSPTGISREGLIDKDSGVIEFADGEITHVLFEKQMQRTIFVVKEAKKEAPKAEPTPEASPEQSKEGKKPKTKQK